MATAGSVDGRVLRGQRNRKAVVASFLALIEEGDLRPTARDIAERAGVSLRSVFQHFEDIEEIFAEAGNLEFAKLQPLLAPVNPDGPFEARLEVFVQLRGQLMEAIDPVARASRLREPFSAQLRANRDQLFAAARAQCVDAFAPEIARQRAAIRAQVAAAAAVASSWTTWFGLREEMGLDTDEAGAVLRTMLRQLLQKGPRRAHGG
jgi:AcrR family transcriptional regulator